MFPTNAYAFSINVYILPSIPCAERELMLSQVGAAQSLAPPLASLRNDSMSLTPHSFFSHIINPLQKSWSLFISLQK